MTPIKIPDKLPRELVLYHSYVVTNLLGISFPVLDDTLSRLLRLYFTNSGIWHPCSGWEIIEFCKTNSLKEIVREAQKTFEDLNRFKVPQKLSELTKSLEEDLAESLAQDCQKRLDELRSEKDKPTLVVRKIAPMDVPPKGEIEVAQEDEEKLKLTYKNKFGKRFKPTAEEMGQISSGKTTRVKLLKDKLK